MTPGARNHTLGVISAINGGPHSLTGVAEILGSRGERYELLASERMDLRAVEGTYAGSSSKRELGLATDKELLWATKELI